MKKAVLLIAVMLLLLLCSCGADVGKEAETTPIDASAAATSEKSDDIPFYTKEIKDDPSDPYSGYIKKYCERVVSRFMEEGLSDFEWYMRQIPYMYYCFYDLNGDGVEEMLLGDWRKVGKYTDDLDPPRERKLSAVATLKDGEVEYMDFDSLHWSEFIYDRVLYSNGLVMTTWGPEKNPSCIFAYFDGKELKQKDFLFHLMPDDIYLEIDESEMTEEEYHRRIDEAIGDATPVEIEWRRIDEYGQ